VEFLSSAAKFHFFGDSRNVTPSPVKLSISPSNWNSLTLARAAK
jgi:hypothetical protein